VELDVCPCDLITEYTKLNADRAVHAFPVPVGEIPSGTLQAGRNPEEPPRDLCNACGLAGNRPPPVRPPDWVDPFKDRRASYEAHLNKAKSAALTVQAKAERTMENVAKAKRMLGN
jgi:hypothetical protein